MAFVISPEAEQVTRDLANDLMSPYCPGRTISSCPSEQARKLEDYIMAEAEGGRSKEEIETLLIDRFGEEKLGSKTDPLLVYGSIAAAFLAAIVIVTAARKWMQGPKVAVAGIGPASSAAGGAATRSELDGLEDALDDLDEF
jgi:cytochrome c-type biogenesis protein CcmH/NrfF